MIKLLIDIWAEVLTYENIGIHNSFFDLSSYSLLATRVVALTWEQVGPVRASYPCENGKCGVREHCPIHPRIDLRDALSLLRSLLASIREEMCTFYNGYRSSRCAEE